MFGCNRSAVALQVMLVVAAAALRAQAPPLQNTITGRVVSEATGQPVRLAYVIVHGPTTKTTRVTMSDGEGRFTFDGLPADRYRVGASKRPLLSAATDAAGADVVISLPTGAVVTGSVVDHLGRPESGLEMTLSGAALATPQSATTNHAGEYRFFGLPAGEYTVGAVRRKGELRTVSVGPAAHTQIPPIAVEAAEPQAIPGQTLTPGTNVIAGVAVDEQSGDPLSNAPVTSRSTGLRTLTDVNGRFRFDGIGDNNYILLVEGGGFQPTSAAEVLVKNSARIVDVTLRARRSGSIGGIVRDEVGDPIVGMPVTASRKRMLNSQLLMQPRGVALTDDRGMFELRNLPAGEYLLCACAAEPLQIDPALLRQLGPTAPGTAAVSQLVDDTVQTYSPTYYPGLTRASDSPMVVVGYGDVRAGMDVTMYGVRPFVVSGQLVDDTGAPAGPMQVFLAQDGDVPGAVGVNSTGPFKTGADGRFQFAGVAPGTYSVGAIPATPGNRAPWGHAEVTVVDRDIEKLTVPVGNGLSVTGRVEFSGHTSQPTPALLEKVRITMAPLNLSMMMFLSAGNSGSVGNSATLNGSGRFHVENLSTGPYRVSVTWPGSPWRVHRVIGIAAGPHDDVVTIEAGGAADVVVEMTDAPLATLTGAIVADRRRYEGYGTMRVGLFPTDETKWLNPAQHPGQFEWRIINRDGTFRLENVPPGDYYVVRGSSFDEDMLPSALDRWSKSAVRVTLKAGETTTVSIKP